MIADSTHTSAFKLKNPASSTDTQWNTEQFTSMMNLKKWHLEKYQELRYLAQQIARNEVEASGQQSRDSERT